MPGFGGAAAGAGAALKLCKELLPFPSVLNVMEFNPLPEANFFTSLAVGPLTTKIISLPLPISTRTLIVPPAAFAAEVGAF